MARESILHKVNANKNKNRKKEEKNAMDTYTFCESGYSFLKHHFLLDYLMDPSHFPL